MNLIVTARRFLLIRPAHPNTCWFANARTVNTYTRAEVDGCRCAAALRAGGPNRSQCGCNRLEWSSHRTSCRVAASGIVNKDRGAGGSGSRACRGLRASLVGCWGGHGDEWFFAERTELKGVEDLLHTHRQEHEHNGV